MDEVGIDLEKFLGDPDALAYVGEADEITVEHKEATDE